ncbi:toprim domain-containing protein [Porphyromonas circumdentaria]|nr:toprim domain-containing protein [Porphyromonas circumdentaria]MDO4722368.1 toprim domain-containing protein [Porphyromonas circumdentaria]
MKLNHTTTVSEALAAIEHTFPIPNSNSFSFRLQSPSHEGLSDIRVQELKHPALIQLMRNRRIPSPIAQQYCKEVHYKVNGKSYFSIGFPNNAGGYETLNPFFKGCIPPKEVTLFDYDTESMNLFEGFMDFLSLLTISPKQQNVSALILNSVNNIEKAIPILSKCEKIKSFLDNDDAGRTAFNRLLTLNLTVENISVRFSEYKDLNDFLCQKKLSTKDNQELSTQLKRGKKVGRRR